MATIEKRRSADGDPHYRVKVRLKDHPPQTATFTSRSDANKWAAKVETELREHRHFPVAVAQRHTVNELIERYCKHHLAHKKVADQQARQLHWWQQRMGHLSLADITPALIIQQREALTESSAGARPRSPATVNRYLAALSHVFTVAVKEYEWLDRNPLLLVSRGKESKGRVRFLSDPERSRLLAACQASSNPDLYLAVLLSLATGARRMEVLGLRWPQVDLARKTVTLLETKNGERRALPLGEQPLDLLRDRAKIRRIDSDLVFPGRYPNQPAQFRHAWDIALEVAQIEDFHWHDLRHSAASYLAMSGATLQEIAAILGHKTLAMVKRYAHLSEPHTASVVNRMNAKIFGE